MTTALGSGGVFAVRHRTADARRERSRAPDPPPASGNGAASGRMMMAPGGETAVAGRAVGVDQARRRDGPDAGAGFGSGSCRAMAETAARASSSSATARQPVVQSLPPHRYTASPHASWRGWPSVGSQVASTGHARAPATVRARWDRRSRAGARWCWRRAAGRWPSPASVLAELLAPGGHHARVVAAAHQDREPGADIDEVDVARAARRVALVMAVRGPDDAGRRCRIRQRFGRARRARVR